MEVKDLKAGQGKVDVEVKVKSKGEVRTFNKFGRELRVANAVVSDASGEISFSLWNDDIDKVKEGDTLKITNGYVSEFNGKIQLTSGKFGKMEILGGEGVKADDEPKDEKKAPKKVSKASEPDEVEL